MIDTRARFGFTAAPGPTDDARQRHLTFALPPEYAGRLFDAQEAGASEQQLRDMAAEGLGDRKKDPAVYEHLVLVGGVEHWPRHVVRDHTPTPRRRTGSSGGGRPAGAGDQVPRDQLPARVAQLLDDDPALTAAVVTEQLGVHRNTAQAALTALRSGWPTLMEQRRVNAAQAAAALGYPAGLTRRAGIRAEAILRGRQARPYLAEVTRALHARGWTTTGRPAPPR